jgi:deoxyribonuclease V
MKALDLHPWQVSPEEARRIQSRLAGQVSRESALAHVSLVAGADLSPPDEQGRARAALVVLSSADLEVVEVATAEGAVAFPYVPGLLSFREAPLLLAAAAELRHAPDLLLVDGQGLAHPRRFGIACHLGLLLDRPTIGCAKSRLFGRHAPPGPGRGDWSPLLDGEEVIGAALRTRERAGPLYVSIGHKVDLESAVRWTLACGKGYRIPEPTRLAHLAAAGRLPPATSTARPLRLS